MNKVILTTLVILIASISQAKTASMATRTPAMVNTFNCNSTNYLNGQVRLVQDGLNAIDLDYSSGKISKDDVRFALKQIQIPHLEKCRSAEHKAIMKQIATMYKNL